MSMLKNNNEQKSCSLQMALLHQRWQQIRQMEQQVDQVAQYPVDSRSHMSHKPVELYSMS